MPEPPKVVHLDELESIPGPGSLTWRPVRLALGVGAFGCNAYSAGEAGQDVVEPHTEDPKLAHQELYFVFQPSAWEWTFRAAPLMRSDPARAREILLEGLQAHPESPGIREALASLP